LSESQLSAVGVELELGPAATVLPDTIDAIAAAFATTGLAAQWVPLRGDRSLERDAPPAAEPTLHVRLRVPDELSAADSLAAVRGRLTPALVAIREALPGLPLGIETVSRAEGRRSFSFSRTDTPDSISRAMDAVEAAARTDAGALGWDAQAEMWRRL
jgi:hypothetical protein